MKRTEHSELKRKTKRPIHTYTLHSMYAVITHLYNIHKPNHTHTNWAPNQTECIENRWGTCAFFSYALFAVNQNPYTANISHSVALSAVFIQRDKAFYCMRILHTHTHIHIDISCLLLFICLIFLLLRSLCRFHSFICVRLAAFTRASVLFYYSFFFIYILRLTFLSFRKEFLYSWPHSYWDSIHCLWETTRSK